MQTDINKLKEYLLDPSDKQTAVNKLKESLSNSLGKQDDLLDSLDNLLDSSDNNPSGGIPEGLSKDDLLDSLDNLLDSLDNKLSGMSPEGLSKDLPPGLPEDILKSPTKVPESSSEDLSKDLPSLLPEDFNLGSVNMKTLLDKLNTEDLSKMMEDSMSKVTPDMMDKARKMMGGGQGEELMKEMKKRGMDPHALRAQLLGQQRMMKKLNKKSENIKRVILLTTTRKLKLREIPSESINISVTTILKAKAPLEISCSRIALGPLKGKTIKIWYDPEAPGKNRRATKIVGFPVGGEILIVMEEGDLSESDVSLAEECLE